MRILKDSIVLLVILSIFGCTYAKDRPAAVAGSFYPSNPQELKNAVDGYLSAVPKLEINKKVIAILCPHAGYIYSAPTAAYSYKAIANTNIKTVIIIGNSHHYLLNKGAVYAQGNFQTPLGSVPVNEKLAARIMSKTSLLEANPAPHMEEHSIEVQIPFLQRTLKDFTIVPILLSSKQSMENCKEIGETIAKTIADSGLAGTTLLVASSDMSHYPTWANANMIDSKSLKSLENFDPYQLKKTVADSMSLNIKEEACVFCGEEAIYTTMFAAKALGADSVKVLNYSNAGDVTGDRTRVVGYGSAVFLSSKNKNLKKAATKEASMADDFKVSEKHQKELLGVARQSVEYYLKNNKVYDYKTTDKELINPGAVFVTLTEHGSLRGCIGTTEPQGPLYQAVTQMAIAAATQDPRFPRVTLSELAKLHFEISILSPMRRINNPDEIKPKTHGVMVKKGFGRSGLFLPQVWEQLPDKEEFMGELCAQKAGLSRDAWKDPSTELYVFTVFAFQE
jgi:hypothetical protein